MSADILLQYQSEIRACLDLEASRKAAGERLNPQGRAARLLRHVEAVYKARGANTDVSAYERAFLECAEEIRTAMQRLTQQSEQTMPDTGLFAEQAA